MASAAVDSNLQHVYAKWERKNPWSAPTNQSRSQDLGDGDYRQMIDRGKQAWRNKYGDIVPPPVRHTRRRKQQAPLSIHKATGSNLGHFKAYPTELPVSGRVRPLQGRCCMCVPKSREDLYDNSMKGDGMRNVLHLPTSDRDLISRHYPIIAHTLSRPLDHQYADVTSSVLANQRVRDAIDTAAQETHEQDSNRNYAQLTRSLKRNAKQILNTMKAAISNKLMRLTGWFLHKLLGRLLNSVLVHKGQMRMLKHATQTGCPVIYLPCHRSHLDYILLTFIIYHWDIKAPHVAAGDNLNITFFGRLMKGLGGFFIRRTLDKSGRKDHVYRALLQTYIEELLCHGEDLEFFMEGTRSRSGKAVYPKGGLLSVIVDSYNEGKMEDAYIVPVSISYDKILDGHFNREQMGEKKISESFTRALAAIWHAYNAKYGQVRVDFCQPFSLKEYLQVAQSFSSASSLDGSPTPSPSTASLTGEKSLHRVRNSDPNIYGTEIVVEDMRATIQGLADHVVYQQANSQAIMSTHLLAFLMLTKHRQGGPIEEIIKTFDWLKAEVVNRKRDLGFTGNTRDVIKHACNLLGDVIQVSHNNSSQSEESSDTLRPDVTLTPVTSLPRVFELSYYANNVMSVFTIESVLANALYGVLDSDMSTNQGFGDPVQISRSKLIGRVTRLGQLLRYDFILRPPCMDWEAVLSEAVESFLACEILRNPEEEDSSAHERNRYRSLAQSLSCADDSDTEDTCDVTYTLNVDSAESMERFWFLKSALGGVLECYYVTSCHLVRLRSQSMPEKDFQDKVHSALKERAQNGIAQYNESASQDTLRNCVRALEHLQVVQVVQQVADQVNQKSSVRMLSLSSRYQVKDTLDDFIRSLQDYRCVEKA